MKSHSALIFYLSALLVKLNHSAYNTKVCINKNTGSNNGWHWLAGLAGEWQYDGHVFGLPSYKQVACYWDDKECNANNPRSLKVTGTVDGRGTRYEFFDPTMEGESAHCDDGKYPNRPDACTHWYGWGEPWDSSYPVYACGNERNDPIPTPQPTATIHPTPQQTFTTDYNLIKPVEYNLINPYPECYYGEYDTHFCAELYSQNGNQQDMTHPNYEERLTATLINLARLFPDYYWFDSKYGWPKDDRYDTNEYCGKAASTPLYYNQKANEMTRWHNYDQLHCVQETGHTTCNNPYRCGFFTDYATLTEPECAAASRWAAFEAMKSNYNFKASSEGICGQNGCYLDGHCSAMFDPKHDIIGIGKWKGSYSHDNVYGSDDKDKKYPIVYGAHLDGRYYWNADYWENNKPSEPEKITFLLQWYGVNHDNVKANSVYLLYQNDEHTMTRIQGNDLSGFYEIEMTMNSNDNKHFCEPYAFMVEASDGKTYRLPENSRYFFGTALFDSYNQEPLYECNENHYYKNDNNQWIANDGPLNLITSNNGCIGCSKANNLEALNLNHYNECTGTDTNCYTVNGYLQCRDGYVTSCSIPLLSDCNSACKQYNECPGSDTHCHTVDGRLICSDGYVTSCPTPLTSDCNSACDAVGNHFAANFQAWV